MVDIWTKKESRTYLVVKDSGDSTLGEESAGIWYLQEKGLKYCFLGFVGKKFGHHKLLEKLKNGWELSRR